MSPLPLRTSIETFHGGGSVAACTCAAEGPLLPPLSPIANAIVTATRIAIAAPAAIQRPTGRRAGGSTGMPESRRASRWSIPSAVA